MAKKTFRCRLVTPAAAMVDESVTYASLPAWDGLMGVLPNRAAMLVKLGMGELKLQFPDREGAGGDRSYMVEGGTAQMLGDELTILAERAIPVESLVASDAEAELRALQSKTVDPNAPDRAAAAARLQQDRERARVKLHLAKSRSSI